MLAVARAYPQQCYPMIGLHPCSTDAHFETNLQLLEAWLGRHPFVAIGEFGIDLHWDKTYFAQQQEAFRIQAGWAKQHQLPAVIHTRNSMEEVLALLEEVQDGTLRGIIHCFTGTADDAKRIVELGFHIGLGGVATFKNGGLGEVIPHIPLERIVLETDSPYLAPVPYRGKRNEPYYLHEVAARVASHYHIALATLEEITDANALALYQPSLYDKKYGEVAEKVLL